MQYHSTLLDKNYDTVEELEAAEKQFQTEEDEKNKKKEERSARAKEVEEARLAYVEAGKKYTELLNQFIKDYNSYHFSISEIKTPESMFDFWLNW